MTGYNSNRRPVVIIYQGNGPWNRTNFVLKTPDAMYQCQNHTEAADRLNCLGVRPVLEFRDTAGGAKRYFRDAISDMPLP